MILHSYGLRLVIMEVFMSKKRMYDVVRHLSPEELLSRIKREKDVRVLPRLYFIKYLYGDDSVGNASEKVGVVRAVGYTWLKRWNMYGYDGLAPRFSGGRPSKLTEGQKYELVSLLQEENDWTIKKIRDLIIEKYNVKYSLSHLRIVLRSLGVRHKKLFVKE